MCLLHSPLQRSYLKVRHMGAAILDSVAAILSVSRAFEGWDCAISFLLYSILKSQSLTPVVFMTKEYSDMSLCMGGKIRL